MKIKCRRCDWCGKEMDKETIQYWFRFPKHKFGLPIEGMKTYDICDTCNISLWGALERKTEKWKLEKDEKPKTDVDVLISDGKNYGVGRYFYDSSNGRWGWKVSHFGNMDNVVYWKEMDKLPVSQQPEKEKE